MTDEEIRKAIMTKLTVPVPVAGRALNLAKNPAYAAVHRGEIPSIRIGRRIEVPTAPLRKMLGISGEAA
jgi:hypothetical protein